MSHLLGGCSSSHWALGTREPVEVVPWSWPRPTSATWQRANLELNPRSAIFHASRNFSEPEFTPLSDKGSGGHCSRVF